MSGSIGIPSPSCIHRSMPRVRHDCRRTGGFSRREAYAPAALRTRRIHSPDTFFPSEFATGPPPSHLPFPFPTGSSEMSADGSNEQRRSGDPSPLKTKPPGSMTRRTDPKRWCWASGPPAIAATSEWT